VRLLTRELGGPWRSGPVKIEERVEPLRASLTRLVGGRGMVQVDRNRARPVWSALRGGWHYHVARTGIIAATPAKDMHSHPGDAMGYGAAILFPLGRLRKVKGLFRNPERAIFFGDKQGLGFERPGLKLPK
jgi:hypothetical protein